MKLGCGRGYNADLLSREMGPDTDPLSEGNMLVFSADLEMESGLFPGKRPFGPNSSPMVNLGSKCGLSDLDRLVFLDNLCSRLSMGVISSGSVLAFAMDLFEKGILSTRDTGGLEIRWGDGQVMEKLLQQIARREGFGTPLAVDPTSTQGKAGLIRRSTIINCTLDCLGLCKVSLLSLVNGFDLVLETELTNAVTGRGLEPEDLFLMGERVANLERLLNIDWGLSADQEVLPRMFQTFFYDDSGHRVDRLSSMVQEFYEVMGWDSCGHPLTSTLGRLGLPAGGKRVPADGEPEYLNRIKDDDHEQERIHAGDAAGDQVFEPRGQGGHLSGGP